MKNLMLIVLGAAIAAIVSVRIQARAPSDGAVFGGMFTKSMNQRSFFCDQENALTGACSCPDGFEAIQIAYSGLADHNNDERALFPYYCAK